MIQLSDLIEGARNCVDNAAKVKPGEEVLILSDTTVDLDVVNAYRIAAEMAGGNVSVLTLKSKIAGEGPNKILDEGYFAPWPKMAWHAMVAADVCLNLSYFIEIHSLFGAAQTQWVEQFMDLKNKYGTRLVRVQVSVKETLASPYAKFPQPLLEYIGVSAFRQVLEAVGVDMATVDTKQKGKLIIEDAEVKLTDLEGTNLAFKGLQFTAGWRWKIGGEKDDAIPWKDFGSYNVGLQPSEDHPNAQGVIVTSALHTGPIPRMKITVQDGKGVDIEGGGAAGLRWLRDWEKNAQVSSAGRAFCPHKQPGVNWFEECMYATHPKAFRVGKTYMYNGTEADHSWFTGSRRSGTLHMAFGGGIGKEYKHRDVEIFFPTLVVNKTTIIEKGRLKLLDDPAVRKYAEQYGDPDELLTEDWIPDLP